jgi:hypothetical protein
MKIKKEYWLILTAFCLIGFGGVVGHVITLQEYECSGIGGFVYKEIEWAEQTYSIVSDCQNLNGMNVPVLYYNDDVKQFYCIEKYDCKEEGCRYKDKYLPIIIQK